MDRSNGSKRHCRNPRPRNGLFKSSSPFLEAKPADDITSLETQPAVTPKPTVLFWMIRHLYPSTYRLTDRLFFIKFEILLCRSYLTALGKPPLTGQTISAPRPPRHRPRSSNPARSKSWARRQSLLSHVLDGKLTWKVRILALYHPFTQFGIL